MEMNPNPTNVVDSDVANDLGDLMCDQNESQNRLSICKTCDNFYTDDDQQTKCQASGCNISMMISFKFKQCPLEKW